MEFFHAEPRFFHVHGIGAELFIQFSGFIPFLFSSTALYTLGWLASKANLSASFLPWDERGRRGHRRGMGLERGKRSGLSFRHHEVEGLAPRGLRYSPDIERSKPSHHWNYQSLPLSLYSPPPVPPFYHSASSTYSLHSSFFFLSFSIFLFFLPSSLLPNDASPRRNFLHVRWALLHCHRVIKMFPFSLLSLFFPPPLEYSTRLKRSPCN